MTVRCQKCGLETSDYEFRNTGSDIVPVCSVCTGRKKVVDAIVSVQVSRFEHNFKGDVTLERWMK